MSLPMVSSDRHPVFSRLTHESHFTSQSIVYGPMDRQTDQSVYRVKLQKYSGDSAYYHYDIRYESVQTEISTKIVTLRARYIE